MKRRMLPILLSLALCLSLLPTAALAAGDVDYIYYTWDEDTQTLSEPQNGNVTSATEVTASDTEWNSSTTGGWYVAQGNVTIDNRVTVKGAVRLILADDCTLTVNGGIKVEWGDSLTIYEQTKGTGTLVAQKCTSNYAGIGGEIWSAGGTVAIHGGNVTATGTDNSAGIGGGSGGAGGTITIYGGTVNATSSSSGAGIGSGNLGAGGTVSIYGGIVTASSSSGGAGIGSGGMGVGGQGDGGKITISGGTVTATSLFGAGIGGGGGGGPKNPGAGGNVIITGGTVAASSSSGAGIGSGGVMGTGSPGGPGTFSTGENGHAVIFASSIQDEEESNDPWRGVIFRGNEGGKLYGDTVTPTEDFTIPAGKTLTIDNGKTLVIQEGVTLTNEGTINNSGTIDLYGTLNGTVSGNPVTYKVTGVSLSSETLALDVGDSATLTATVTPENADDKTVMWSSDHSEIVAVTPDTADSKKATITAKGAGTATITATAADGSGKTATCTVTVEQPYTPPPANPNYRIDVTTTEGGTVDKNPAAAKAGETVTLTPTPEEGYEVGEVTVIDRFGEAVAVTENPDGTYTFTMPNGQVTVEVTFTEMEAEPLPFTDVAETDWFHDAVQYAYENGLMDGVGDGQFAPNATTNRAMVVTILYRLAGEPDVSGDVGFADVAAGQWYTDAVLWAAQKGIVNGISATEFSPAGDLTREQLATILYRYAQDQGYDVSASADLSGFPDADQIQSYATQALSWAVAEGLLQGFEDDSPQPGGTATRAQIATILMRFCQTVAK